MIDAERAVDGKHGQRLKVATNRLPAPTNSSISSAYPNVSSDWHRRQRPAYAIDIGPQVLRWNRYKHSFPLKNIVERVVNVDVG